MDVFHFRQSAAGSGTLIHGIPGTVPGILNGSDRRFPKSRLICFLMACALFLLLSFGAGSAHAQGPVYTTAQQLLDLFADQKKNNASQVEFTCSDSLYSYLWEDNFFELYHLLVKAGIDHGQVSISYNDYRHFIQISGLRYEELPWAECENMDDVRAALSTLAGALNGFILLTNVSFAEHLLTGNTLRLCMLQNGIESYYTLYSLESGIIKISQIRYFEVPYRYVEDFLQFSAAVSEFWGLGIDDFYIVFEPELFARIFSDPEQNTFMLGSSKLGNHRSSTDADGCVIRYSDVEFTTVPREICRRVSDVPDAIRRMGAAGIRNFEMIFPDTAVFEALFRDDFALLYSLEAEAGMSSGKISYSSAGDRIIFTDAEITADAVMLTSLREALDYTEAQVASGNGSIHLFCTPELFDALVGDLHSASVEGRKLSRIYDLTAHTGIFNYDISVSDAAHVINIYINRLYPGTAVMRAVRSGSSDGLTPREMEVWASAARIAEAAQAPDPVQTARAIHDWLCANVVYVDDDATDEDDNAIGAILNGRSNCDGYADAFYLIGSLAGLNVRYQHGDTYQQLYTPRDYSVTHLWNLLEIGGQWRMVDVTWDDEPNGWSYHWFNVGRDIADQMHVWNDDMTKPLAPN